MCSLIFTICQPEVLKCLRCRVVGSLLKTGLGRVGGGGGGLGLGGVLGLRGVVHQDQWKKVTPPPPYLYDS